MIFKLAEAAEKSWRRLNGHNQLPKVILGVKFTDGIEIVRAQAAVRIERTVMVSRRVSGFRDGEWSISGAVAQKRRDCCARFVPSPQLRPDPCPSRRAASMRLHA
jgi:hypothetical protein